MLFLLLAPIAAVGYYLNRGINDGTIKIPDIIEGGNIIPDPLAGVTNFAEKITMLIMVSAISMFILAITFTYLYPKWK